MTNPTQTQIEYTVIDYANSNPRSKKAIALYAGMIGTVMHDCSVTLKDDKFTFTLQDGPRPLVQVQDLTVLSEEEFFQLSLLWTHASKIEYVRKIQELGISVLNNPSTIQDRVKIRCTIQY